MSAGRFLGGMAALIRDPRGRYLLLRRSRHRDYAPGAWECVTGRLQQGEGFEDALHREVSEETGLAVAVEDILGTSHFHRGPADAGHELIGVVYACVSGKPDDLRLSAEHDDARWMDGDEALALLTADDPATAWLRRVLERAERRRRGMSGEEGFELG